MKNNHNTLESLIILGLIGAPLIGLIWTLWMLAPAAPMPAPLAVVVSSTPMEIQHRQPSVRLKRADCQTYQCLEPLKPRSNDHE